MITPAIASYPRSYDYPVKVLQFGEGSFLRAFWDKAIHDLNRKNLFQGQVAVVQPIRSGKVTELGAQGNLYTVCLQENGRQETEVVESVKLGIDPFNEFDRFVELSRSKDIRIIISNTTEAGIIYDESDTPSRRPPESFPGKLLSFLYNRYEFFSGAADRGCLIFPCELIENNGNVLFQILVRLATHHDLGDQFVHWLTTYNIFFNTLVDGIVTGYPHDAIGVFEGILGYRDNLFVTGEAFQFLVIEGDSRYRHEIPVEQSGIEVIWTDDISAYRTIKVRLLNGLQTFMSMVGFLAGIETEKEAIEHDEIGPAMERCLYQEIVPSVELPPNDKAAFAKRSLIRLRNPYIKHYLSDINLNCFSKYKTRVLPSLRCFLDRPQDAPFLVASLGVLFLYFNVTARENGEYRATYNGSSFTVRDNGEILDAIVAIRTAHGGAGLEEPAILRDLTQSESLWGEPLDLSADFIAALARHVAAMKDGTIGRYFAQFREQSE